MRKSLSSEGQGKKTLVRENNTYKRPEEGESTVSLRNRKMSAWFGEDSGMK